MNLKKISIMLSKLFNTYGNKYIQDNYDISEPIRFSVYLRRSDFMDDMEKYNYVAEIYSYPQIPNQIDINTLSKKFSGMVKYMDESFGDLTKSTQFKFMDIGR
jgi:hypothetical protein